MRSTRQRLGVLVIVSAIAVGVLIGCTQQPVPSANKPQQQSKAVLPTTTTVSMPPRPRAIPLDNRNPCKLLTKDQREQLSLDNTPNPYTDPAFGNAKACSIRGNGSGMVARLALVTVSGIDLWRSEYAQAEIHSVQAGGFPALVVRTPGQDLSCNVDVDVAPGQFLDVLFRDGGNAQPATQDQLCLAAHRVADAVMITLANTN